MKKSFYVALMALASAAMFVTCEGNKNTPDRDSAQKGEWITSASQIDPATLDNQQKYCWWLDMWCDGTVIGREYTWATESEVGAMIKTMLEIDLKTFGKQTKKFMYGKSNANDPDACAAEVWEGAVCWEETISYGGQSETNYGWMPEANMKERHDYFEAKGLTHTYKRADAKDFDSCDKLNPGSDDDPEKPEKPDEPKDYSKYDSTTYKCWEITQEAYGMTVVNYRWDTEKVIVMMYDLINIDYTYRHVTEADNEDACDKLKDSEDRPEACWKITATVMGVTQVSYYWGTEAEAEAQVNAINSTGMGTASYVKTAATDPDSCHE